jgi:DNA-binding response OmpR family regulator
VEQGRGGEAMTPSGIGFIRGVPAEPRPRPCVLVVEDSITVLNLYARVFGEQFHVLSATRGEEGYALACTGRPDAVVVDALLPDIDGLNLCERLVANPSTAWIPLIVVTGDDAAYRRALTMPSLDAVRKKPCPANELLALLFFAMSMRRIQSRERRGERSVTSEIRAASEQPRGHARRDLSSRRS